MHVWLLTDGLLEKRGEAVQFLHKNAFVAYNNLNHLLSRVSVSGMDSMVSLRSQMYGEPKTTTGSTKAALEVTTTMAPVAEATLAPPTPLPPAAESETPSPAPAAAKAADLD